MFVIHVLHAAADNCQPDTWINGLLDEWMDWYCTVVGWSDGWDTQMDGWMDGWMDGQTNITVVQACGDGTLTWSWVSKAWAVLCREPAFEEVYPSLFPFCPKKRETWMSQKWIWSMKAILLWRRCSLQVGDRWQSINSTLLDAIHFASIHYWLTVLAIVCPLLCWSQQPSILVATSWPTIIPHQNFLSSNYRPVHYQWYVLLVWCPQDETWRADQHLETNRNRMVMVWGSIQ